MPIQLGILKLYTVKELSKILKVTPITIRTFIRTGKIKGRKIGRKWHVSEDSLKEFFNCSETSNNK